jgi:glutamate synthase (NADPH/NADH) small chain
MGDPTGFMKHDRNLPTRRPVPVRILDWNEVYEPFPEDELKTQASRCMDCGIPFCNSGCPLGNLIPDWNDLVYRDNWSEAIERLHATNNFPEFTGRLCPAPCEGSCVLGIHEPPVTIKQVEVEIIERAFSEGWVAPVMPQVRTGKRVAVVGSGPAGMAAAQQLTRAGHDVTVYERADRIGGLMRYGIPEFKMEKKFLDRRMAQMEAEGTVFRTSVDIGTDISADELKADNDIVVLAGGATQWRDLPIPGREGGNILQAMEFLPPANKVQEGDLEEHPTSAEGLDVIIIGGGDTGADCLGTVLRHGAKSVHQFEIMPEPPGERAASNPWPAWPMILRTPSAHEEAIEIEDGDVREYGINTLEFQHDAEGNVSGLQTVRVSQEMVDGRPSFVPVEGSEEHFPAQMVLLAMGFTGPEKSPLLTDMGVDLTNRGNVDRGDDWSTNVDNVFVCGDMGRGQSLIVWAIAEGRSCAAAVDAALMGETSLPSPVAPTDQPLR